MSTQTNIERRLDKTLFAGLYADVSSIWQSCMHARICIVELSITALPGTEDTNQGIMSQMRPPASTKAAEARG